MKVLDATRTALALAAFAAMGTAYAKTYVLSAPTWGAAQNASVAAAGGSVRFSDASGVALVSSDNADFLASVLGSGAITSGAADAAINQPLVRVVESGFEAAGLPAPTDTYYPYVQWAPQAIGAPAAWAAGYTGKGVRVAVIDGGVYGAHPDLTANVDAVAARSFVPGAAGSCEAAWNCDTGTFWHGTHVSGIIAAPANGIGVVGIAPQATIVPVKALHNGTGSFGSIIQAILYASGEGRADIINMSLGAVLSRQGRESAELGSAMNRAVNTAAARGVLVLSSAGNDALDLDHSGNLVKTPAQNGNGLAVSATGPFGFGYGATDFARFASYSNFGSSLVSVAGPGGDFVWPTDESCTKTTAAGAPLTRPCWAFDMVLSTTRAGYSWAAGTSMATPAVAGVAALIKQKYPDAPVGALKNRLMNSSDDQGKPGADPYYGRGFVNAAKAVGL